MFCDTAFDNASIKSCYVIGGEVYAPKGSSGFIATNRGIIESCASYGTKITWVQPSAGFVIANYEKVNNSFSAPQAMIGNNWGTAPGGYPFNVYNYDTITNCYVDSEAASRSNPPYYLSGAEEIIMVNTATAQSSLGVITGLGSGSGNGLWYFKDGNYPQPFPFE